MTKTRRECIPEGSVAAPLLLTVLVNTSVLCTTPSDLALRLARPGFESVIQFRFALGLHIGYLLEV